MGVTMGVAMGVEHMQLACGRISGVEFGLVYMAIDPLMVHTTQNRVIDR